jgi:hypothetical protein
MGGSCSSRRRAGCSVSRAHYAAAKAGLVGLSNVISIEGAEHGIKSNTVLPFGFSRMVTETIGDPKALEEIGFTKVIKPELVVPIVVFLASRACELTHQNYSACGGRFARVFVGLGEGWLAEPDSQPTADDIVSHLSEVTATDPIRFPAPSSKVFAICERLGVNVGNRPLRLCPLGTRWRYRPID